MATLEVVEDLAGSSRCCCAWAHLLPGTPGSNFLYSEGLFWDLHGALRTLSLPLACVSFSVCTSLVNVMWHVIPLAFSAYDGLPHLPLLQFHDWEHGNSIFTVDPDLSEHRGSRLHHLTLDLRWCPGLRRSHFSKSSTDPLLACSSVVVLCLETISLPLILDNYDYF